MFIGVDGCKKGWFVVKLTDGVEWETGVFENIDAICGKGLRGHIFICHEIYFKVASIKKLAHPNAEWWLPNAKLAQSWKLKARWVVGLLSHKPESKVVISDFILKSRISTPLTGWQGALPSAQYDKIFASPRNTKRDGYLKVFLGEEKRSSTHMKGRGGVLFSLS